TGSSSSSSPTRPGSIIRGDDPPNPPQARCGPRRSIARPWGACGPRRPREQAARLVRVVAPVVLEDEADRREHREQHADQEQPPADRETERSRSRGQTHKQRPPAMRAEEPDLAGALLDLAAVVVFRAPGQAP